MFNNSTAEAREVPQENNGTPQQASGDEKTASPPEYDGHQSQKSEEKRQQSPPANHEGPEHGPWGRQRCGPRRGACGGTRHGRAGFPFGGSPFGGPGFHGPPPHIGGFHHGGRGHFGSRDGPPAFDMKALTDFLTERFGINSFDDHAKDKSDKDFTPAVDVFDTQDAYIIHLSLPGAKKEDVGVNWDADKSELSVGGVVYRAGDEETLKTLAMDERDVGVFERKVRLGSRANPANVEVEGISARMEDGVLVVKVPKVEEFVEVKKVDIE